MIDFIDLGCGIGGSIEWAKNRFGGEKYLGIDNIMSDFLKGIDNGYNLIFADITDDNFIFPKARYFTMLHLLEHLKDESIVEKVIKKCINSATEFVFIKGPFFDNLDYLKSMGFKITWTDWTGHPTHVTSDMLKRITNNLGVQSEIGYQYPISDSNSNEIIPLSAKKDTVSYDDSLGGKIYTKFSGIYREVYCYINVNCSYWEELKKTNIL